MTLHPCGVPVLCEDVARHEDNCIRCIAATHTPWTVEDEARAELAHHPVITTPRKVPA